MTGTTNERFSGWRHSISSPGGFTSRAGRAREELPPTAQFLLDKKAIAWSSGETQQLKSIAKIADGENYYTSLLTFARNLKAEREPAKAGEVLAALAGEQKLPEAIRKQVDAEYRALAGGGSFGLRVETLAGQFIQQATDARVIAPMLGASLLGQAVGTWTLGRLAATPGSTWLTRGFGARFVAGGAAYAAEFPVFAGLNRALAPSSGGNFGDGLLRSALTLGSLKVFGSFGRFAGSRGARIPGALGTAVVDVSAQSSAFLGLMAAHKLEERFGLRPPSDAASAATDAVASLVGLGVGAHLGRRLLGSPFLALQNELALRSQAKPNAPSSGLDWNPGYGLPANGPRTGETLGAGPGKNLAAPMLMSILDKDGANGGGAKTVVPVPGTVDRELAGLHSQISGYLDAIPPSLPEHGRLKKEMEALWLDLLKEGGEAAFRDRSAAIEKEIESVLIDLQRASAGSLEETLRRMSPEIPDESLRLRIDSFPRAARESVELWEAHGRFRETLELFVESAKALMTAEWNRGSEAPPPEELPFSLGQPLANLYFLNLFRKPISVAVLKDYLAEGAAFYRDFPPRPDEYLALQPEGRVTPHNFLLGSDPTADQFLETIASNLRGFRRLFGPDAGSIFHGDAFLSGELRTAAGAPSGFFLVADKGQNEYFNGLRLALFRGNPRHKKTDDYLAKVGLHFGGDDSLKIVNIQGAVPNLFGRNEDLRELGELLGQAAPLDTLIAAAILLAKNAGFARVDGIKDGAQIARADDTRNEAAGGFYDLFFRKFGFRAPGPREDYWILSLENFQIHRKRTRSAAGGGDAALDPLEAQLPRGMGSYFFEILQRRTRDADGRRQRPKDWDLQQPARGSGAVRAFWRSVAPALSNLTWQASRLGYTSELKVHAAQPFRLRSTAPDRHALPAYFSQAAANAESLPSALSPPFLAMFRRIQGQGAAGRVSVERAARLVSQVLEEDWIREMQRFKARTLRYPLDVLFEGMNSEGQPGLAWVQRWLATASGRKSVVEVELSAADYSRYCDAHQANQRKIEFFSAILELMALDMGLSQNIFHDKRPDGSRILRIPSEDFLFEGPAAMSGKNAVGWAAVPDLVTEAEAHDLMKSDLRPMVLATHEMELHDNSGVHPLVGLFHDHYHRFKLSRFSRETRAELVALHEIFTELSGPFPHFEAFRGLLLDGDLGGHSHHRSLFSHIKEAGPTEAEKEAIHEKLIARFSGSVEGGKIIETFEEVVLGRPPSDPKGKRWFLTAAASAAMILGMENSALASDGAVAPTIPGFSYGPLVAGAAVFAAVLYAAYRWKKAPPSLSEGEEAPDLSWTKPVNAPETESDPKSRDEKLKNLVPPLGPTLIFFGLAAALTLSADHSTLFEAARVNLPPGEPHHPPAPAVAWIGGFSLWTLLREILKEPVDNLLTFLRLKKKPPPPPSPLPPPDSSPPRSANRLEEDPANVRYSWPPQAGNANAAPPPPKPKLRPPEWIKRVRFQVERILNDKNLVPGEKEPDVRDSLASLKLETLTSVEAVEVAHLMWDMSFDLRLGEEAREWMMDDYLKFVNKDLIFPVDSPQVYREAFRLRRIFSNANLSMQKRTYAIVAYVELAARMDGKNALGHKELTSGELNLEDFLAEREWPRKSMDKFFVKSGLNYVRNRLGKEDAEE